MGSTLARGLDRAGYPIRSLYNQTVTKASELASELGVDEWSSFPVDVHSLGDLVFLTIPDDRIEEVANKLADLGKDFSDYIICHCSGFKTRAVLKPLEQKNALTAAFHPMQTFNKESGADSFNNIFFDIEAADDSRAALTAVARNLGAESIFVSANDKSFLHAAGVMASNYLVTLLDTASELGSKGTLDKAEVLQLLEPLVQQTITNARQSGTTTALSGPIARGDISTIEQHLQLLQDQPALQELYKAMGKQTIEVALQKGSLSKGKALELQSIFEQPDEL